MLDSCYTDTLRYQDSIIHYQKGVIAEQRFQIDKRDALFDSWQKAKVAEDELQDRMIIYAKEKGEDEFRRTLVVGTLSFMALTILTLLIK